MEAELRSNISVSTVRVELTDLDKMHTLTNESQEVMAGLITARVFPIDVTTVDP